MIYAYRYILFFARNENRIENKKIVAEIEGLPLNFISKISAKLKQAGIIASHYGISGGNNLAKPLEEITVYDVAVALHGKNVIKDYFSDERLEKNVLPNSIDDFFTSLKNRMIDKMKKTTFADIISNEDLSYFSELETSEEIPQSNFKKNIYEEKRKIEEIAKKKQTKEIAKNLLDILTVDMISQKTGLTVAEIKKLKNKE